MAKARRRPRSYPSYLIYREGFENSAMGRAAAIAFILCVLILLLTALQRLAGFFVLTAAALAPGPVQPRLGKRARAQRLSTWNEFLLPLIVARASPDHWTLPLGLSTLGRGGAGGQSFDYPVMLAGSMLTIIPVAIVFIVLQRFFARGIMAGAVKADSLSR